MNAKTPQQTFELAQVYLIKADFSHRGNPLSRPPTTPVQPQQVHILVGIEHLRPMDAENASHIRLRVTTNQEDEKGLYDFDVEIGGIVHNVNRDLFPAPQLAIAVSTILFPFLRETVANVTMRGRFGPVWLRPMDMTALLPGLAQNEEEQEVAPAGE